MKIMMEKLKSTTRLVAMFMALGVAMTAAAPRAKIHVILSAKSFFVGEEFVYEILISPAAADLKVVADAGVSDDDLAVKLVGQTRVESDGASGVSIRYRMIPLRAGEVRISSMGVQAGDQLLTTEEEAFIDVRQAQAYPGMQIVRGIPAQNYYMGEPFRVDYTWVSPLSLNGFRAVKFGLPLFEEAAFKINKPHDEIAEDAKESIALPVAGTRVRARYGSFSKQENRYYTVSFSKIVVPLSPGEIMLEPATLLASYRSPTKGQGRQQGWRTNYPSYFDNNFFSTVEGETYQKYFVASDRNKIRVLPLPEEGKPRDFAGQVGRCKISVSATPTVLRAGEPITLTIVVDGYSFPEVFELPDLGRQLAFSRQFTMPARQSTGRIDGGRKTYIRTLRPLGQDTTAIPSVRLPYFDPRTGSYGVARSAPIAITVKPAEIVTAFDATLSGAGKLSNRLAKNPQGIRANFPSMASSKSRLLTDGQWLGLLFILPPVGFVFFLLMTSRSRLMRRDPVKARALGAMKRFRRSVRQLPRSSSSPSQQLAGLDDIVRNYFSEKLNLVRHAHTFEDLERRLGGEADLGALRRVYESCEYERYCDSDTSEAPDVLALIDQTEQVILTLDPQIS